MKTIDVVSDSELIKHHCLESADIVPDDPETTAFKKRARLHQALWRESKGYETGTQPMNPKMGQKSRPLGSRIDLAVAKASQDQFLTKEIRRAVADRLANPQPHQMINEDRLYCDLLSSMPMCFNLFGTLHSDLELADRAVHAWWPDVPGRVCAVRFEWSPGRALKGEYLENRSAFDVAFELDLENGNKGVLGIETKYHEHCKPDKTPSENRLRRYTKIGAESKMISEASIKTILGTDLQQIWLDHLLALSMIIHPSRKWSWSKFVLIHPVKNPSYARATERYRSLLKKANSFQVNTIESLLDEGVLPPTIKSAFSKRYLWS